MADNIKIVPAVCTQCGGTLDADPQAEEMTCPYCGTKLIVEKAINNYNVQHANIEHADNVNIDMTGSVKTVLDFVGEQMKESRAERREAKKEAAERDRIMTANFFKMFWIMFAVVAAVTIIGYFIFMIMDVNNDDSWNPEYIYSEDETISCYIDWNDMLSVNITDPGSYEWKYDRENSTEKLVEDEADFDGYHFTIEPNGGSGTGYAVVAEYDKEAVDQAFPESYGVVKFTYASGRVTEITEAAHIPDLSQYNFSR